MGAPEIISSPVRVMIVSKFFYRRGGAEVHAIELERLLAGEGIPTAVFAMSHPLNIAPVGELFTAPQVAVEGSLTARVRGAMRVMGGAGVRASFRRALNAFRPTVILLHNIHSYLSPAVAEIAASRGIRVIWTLHDYKLVCPSYSLIRSGRECRECLASPWPVMRHRCMKGSAVASALALAEALRWNRRKIIREVDHFICPSQFMADRMAEGGFPPDRLTVIHNFVTAPLDPIREEPRAGVCYIGRLSPEKGVETLLRSAVGAPWGLTIAGAGPLDEQLRATYGREPNITFAGRLTAPEVTALLTRSAVAVAPSECDENCSLSIIEALCCGTPVVASASGGNPELVTPGNGLLFPRGDATALRAAIDRQLTAQVPHTAIAQEARTRFSPAAYLTRLHPLTSPDRQG